MSAYLTSRVPWRTKIIFLFTDSLFPLVMDFAEKIRLLVVYKMNLNIYYFITALLMQKSFYFCYCFRYKLILNIASSFLYRLLKGLCIFQSSN